MFNKMYDVITFGSASQDIFVESGDFKILEDKKDFATGEGLCLPSGSKIDIQDIIFTSGGGGTNVAATFAKQGFKTAFCGAIGADTAGLEIVRELKAMRIDTRFLVKKKDKKTNQSIVMSNNGEERTILVYRGASEAMCKTDIPWKKLKAKWFYVAPLSGVLCDNLTEVLAFARQNKIKVAINPSKRQLSMPIEQLKDVLKNVDILFLNQEEAAFLTKIPFEDEGEIFRKIDELCPGIAVMTKGGDGVVVSDGKHLYSAKPHPGRKIVDTTGAGDSLGSGFLAEFIRTNGDIEKSIQFGLANSAGNLSEIGAKTGLLEKSDNFERVPVQKQLCTENNLCIPK